MKRKRKQKRKGDGDRGRRTGGRRTEGGEGGANALHQVELLTPSSPSPVTRTLTHTNTSTAGTHKHTSKHKHTGTQSSGSHTRQGRGRAQRPYNALHQVELLAPSDPLQLHALPQAHTPHKALEFRIYLLAVGNCLTNLGLRKPSHVTFANKFLTLKISQLNNYET